MFKIIYIVILALFVPVAVYASQPVKGEVKDKSGNPLPGANIYWADTRTGVVTDEKGHFMIEPSGVSKKLVVSFIGYNTDTVEVRRKGQPVIVVLHDNVLLSEVVVSQRAIGTINSRLDPLQTQKITYEELCRAACCNLAESFETNPSVDVTYSDAATGARQIRLLGLSGTYVQMLTEQVPDLRGAAALYGLAYVPGPWMESIQVSKGTASVKNGYESLTGQINIEYKKPQAADPLSVNLFGASNGRLEANVDGNIAVNKNLATGLLLHYSNETMEHDANDDGFMDLPKTQQFNALNRWYYKKDRVISQVAAQVIHEKRESGQTTHAPTEGGDLYGVDIATNRGSFFTKNAYIFNPAKNSSMALIFSGSFHDQKSLFGHRTYDVNQHNLYASLLYETEFTSLHRFSSGLSFNYDRYDERYNTPGGGDPFGDYPLYRKDVVPGAYAQYTFNLHDKLVVLAGVRGDYHNRAGFFVTPRLHVKYDLFSFLTLRASAGKGYRMANVLNESSFLLASNRRFMLMPGLDSFEEAWNYGASASFNIPLAGKNLGINLEWYYTDFLKQVVIDMDADAHAVSFYNLNGRSYAQNAQIEATYPFFRGFTLTGAFRLTDAKIEYKGGLREKPLTNRYKALATASYQTPLKKWQFDVTASFNGPGRLPNPDEQMPLWKSEFKPYTLLNAQITKYFRTWSIYVGGENLTNYRQKTPIIAAGDPWGNNFDASMIYAPVHGAKFYVGVRWSLPKKE